MKFVISRTSLWKEKPCEEAKMEDVLYLQQRSCSEKEFDEHFSKDEGLWRSQGKNHRVLKNGNICRDQEDTAWVIELEDFKDLIKFAEKYGALVLESGNYNLLEIEIYDDCRE
ncbi:MAG: hypothetical protein FJ241_10640 [Nitrospira sp.]|nr:hypothetical protein [Nitrospira sp.]